MEGKITKNFRLSEFDCNDGTKVPEHLINNVTKLANNLQVLRDTVGTSINITSSYRHEKYNQDVGGVSSSKHITAEAADVQVSGYPPNIIYDLIEELIRCGDMEEGGVGLYNTFVHYDIRGTKARWDYSGGF